MTPNTPQTLRPAQTLAPAAPQPAAVAKRRSVMNALAARLDVEPAALLKTLQTTVFRGATNEEFMALCIVSNKYGLDPLTKEIYAFPAKGGGIVPVVSVDGWCRIANARPEFDGCEFEAGTHPDFGPFIRCTVYRKDRAHPTVATEFLAECEVPTSPAWKNCPMRMLRHRAFIQAVRLAFGFSGIYAPEDGDASESLPPVLPAEAAPAQEQPSPPREAAPEAPAQPAAPAAPEPQEDVF